MNRVGAVPRGLAGTSKYADSIAQESGLLVAVN